MERLGILAVNRFEFLRKVLALRTRPLPDASVVGAPWEVFAKYRGLDGIAWPDQPQTFRLDEGLAPASELDRVEAYVADRDHPEDYDVVLLSFDSGAGSKVIGDSVWHHIGFDVGYCHADGEVYSVVLNEVIYGHRNERRWFARKLNEYLLFESKETAMSLVAIHAKLFHEGADVEGSEPIHRIGISIRRASASPRPRG